PLARLHHNGSLGKSTVCLEVDRPQDGPRVVGSPFRSPLYVVPNPRKQTENQCPTAPLTQRGRTAREISKPSEVRASTGIGNIVAEMLVNWCCPSCRRDFGLALCVRLSPRAAKHSQHGKQARHRPNPTGHRFDGSEPARR